ncbi:MAG: CPBP family intramembrane glutamic endopeptidase [Oscillospiraceae bacterium]
MEIILKLKPIMKCIGFTCAFLGIYYGAQLISSMIAGVAIMVPMLTSTGGIVDPSTITSKITDSLGGMMPYILILAIAISILCYFFIQKGRKTSLLKSFDFKKLSILHTAALAIFALSFNFALQYVMDYLSKLGALEQIFNQYSKLINMIIGGSFWLNLLTVGILVPIFEELLFRGLVYTELRKVSKVTIAIVIQGLLFGVYHMNIIQGAYAAILGIVLGYVYYKFKTILAPIVIHIVLNSSSVLLSTSLGEKFITKYNSIIQISSPIILIVIFAIIVFVFKKEQDSKDLQGATNVGDIILTDLN